LRQRGLPSRASSFFGDSAFLDRYSAADPRLVGLWASVTAQPGVGGYPLQSIGLTPLSFRLGVVADTVDIYDRPRADGATMEVTVQNRVARTVAPASGSFRRTTVTFPREPSPEITIRVTSQEPTLGPLHLLGMDAYDSTTPEVAVWNMGAAGFRTVEWLGAGETLAAYDPDLTLINLGINDLGQALPVETYRRNMRTIVLAAKAAGDVVLIVPNQVNPSYFPLGRQQDYEAALRDLAAELGVVLFSVPAAIGEFSQAQASGFMADDTHPSAAGYARIADALAELLAR
jgi:lysophospholipase L1-like esterase